MSLFNIIAVLLTLSALFSYLNHRFFHREGIRQIIIRRVVIPTNGTRMSMRTADEQMGNIKSLFGCIKDPFIAVFNQISRDHPNPVAVYLKYQCTHIKRIVQTGGRPFPAVSSKYPGTDRRCNICFGNTNI